MPVRDQRLPMMAVEARYVGCVASVTRPAEARTEHSVPAERIHLVHTWTHEADRSLRWCAVGIIGHRQARYEGQLALFG